jgi:25S rRNA (uracil2634-N3)-methyltransferase
MGKRKCQHLTGPSKNTWQQKPHPQAHAALRTDHLDHNTSQKAKSATRAQHGTSTIPFLPNDHILLIGEGDLSFARALVQSLGCVHVTATVLEKDRKELEDKYPHVGVIVEDIENGDGKIVFGVDARKMRRWQVKVDGGREVRVGRMDKVVFNFPHVGGKSTDVNRQVSGRLVISNESSSNCQSRLGIIKVWKNSGKYGLC